MSIGDATIGARRDEPLRGTGCRRRVHAERVHRGGFTLPELLIALVLFAAVAGAAMRVLRTHQRFLRGAAEIAELRSELRQAVHLLPAELRSVSPGAGDVHEWSATTLKFRAVTGSSVVCRRASDSVLVLPMQSPDDLRTISSWLASPQAGDSLLVHDAMDIGTMDDTWRAYEIGAVTSVSDAEGCDSLSGLMLSGDAGRTALRLRLGGPHLSATIRAGAPVRIYRPIRYALYQGGDGRWYLGASDCRALRVPPCSTIQPVSGPYRSGGAGEGEGGLHLSFEDVSGETLHPGTDDPRRIATVRLLVRGETRGAWWRSGTTGRFRDSLAFTVAVRNRRMGRVSRTEHVP